MSTRVSPEQIWISDLNKDQKIQSQFDRATPVRFYDTTLRDGEQTVGVVFTPDEKAELDQGVQVLDHCPGKTPDLRFQSRLRPAFRMHTTSAWAVGSPLCTRWLCPRATICPPSSTRTDPMGIPPCSQDCSA